MSVFRSNFKKFLFAAAGGSGDISQALVVSGLASINNGAAAGFVIAHVTVNATGTWTLSLPDSESGRAVLDGNDIKTTSIPFDYSANPAPVIEVKATRASDGLSIQKTITLTILPIISVSEKVILPETGDTPFELESLASIPDDNEIVITIPVGFAIDYIIPEGV